jgi:molecular chaperone GrpE
MSEINENINNQQVNNGGDAFHNQNNDVSTNEIIEKLNLEIEDLKKKLEESEKAKEEYLAGWQRARADFSNYRKDEAERFKQFIQYSNEELIKDLIPVLDSFDLAISTLEKSGGVDKGIYMIKAKLEDVLKNYGLVKINIEVGKPLDPSIAEPILQVENDELAGNVLEEIEAGYKLHNKVIRPARVKVAVNSKNKN